MKAKTLYTLLLIFVTMNASPNTVKIKNISEIYIGEEIQANGYGIVIGLKGTGDSPKNFSTAKSISEYLETLGITINPTNFIARNSASVIVSAKISPMSVKGTTIDVNVASIFDARSIEGGILLKTPLKDNNGRIVAFAQGNIITPKIGSKTSGIIPNGGIVIEDISEDFLKDQKLKLSFKNVSYNTINLAIKKIKENFPNVKINILTSDTIEIEIPNIYRNNEMEFIATIMELEIEITEEEFVAIDSKNNTVVITGNVKLYPVSISYKGMKITFSEFGGFIESGEIFSIPSTDLKEFVDQLSKIGIKSEDLISILLLMKEIGAIKAKFVVK